MQRILSRATVAIANYWVDADRQWHCEYHSTGCATIYGYTQAELLAEPDLWQSQILPDDRALVRQLLAESLETASVQTAEYRFTHKNGAVRWIASTIAPDRDDAANGWFVTLTSTDITERKQAELAARSAMEREQQLIRRERFINAVGQNIRQSLDLDYILTTTVEEVQQFLQVDRVVIYRFNPIGNGKTVAEALEEDTFSILEHEIQDPCLHESLVKLYQQGRVQAIDDVDQSDLSPCYRQLLASIQVRAILVMPILIRQELWGLLVAHQCTGPRQWGQTDWRFLQQLTTQLAIGIHQAELYQQTQQQALKERALNQIIQAIRNSLDLNTIFTTATTEMGRLLNVDRVEIVQYLAAEQQWLKVASYGGTNSPDGLDLPIPDYTDEFANHLKHREVVRIHHAAADASKPTWMDGKTGAGASLWVPLSVGTELWGSLSVSHQQRTWFWQDWQVETVCAIADQLAMAIQQSQLYQQVRQLNANLETQVQERTAQLQQSLNFEALLKRITDKVRDSLDEGQILSTAVQELAIGLHVDCCDAALYDLERRTATICYESIHSDRIQPAVGKTVSMDAELTLYEQGLNGQCIQFCSCAPSLNSIRGIERQYTVLLCPLIDDRAVLGDLWLFKPLGQVFDHQEMRLVQQVANQCAIAIRQSRLYQAAQSQVEELARLNQLKDDFLSTVSHELRTPLSNIKLSTQMLILTLRQAGFPIATDEPANLTLATGVDRYFKILREECDREISLINDLLELTRLDAATEPLLLSTINLHALLPHLTEPFLDRMQAQHQQLQINLPPTLPHITTDLTYLERILSELLTNACKYTPIGETITIAAQVVTSPHAQTTSLTSATPQSRLQISGLQIWVSNSGVEIPAQEYDRIFEKFYRIPNRDPWRYGGTGLGLALVKRLAERLQATVSVESAVGQTHFILQLPLQL